MKRIASLLASGTEIVQALGLGDGLVAISHECDYPPEVLDRPRVSRPRFDPIGLTSGEVDRAVRRAMEEHGSVYEVSGDRLEALRPDVVLTQAVCEVCAVPTPGVRELVASRGLSAEVVSLDAHTLEDVFGCIAAVGRAAGVEARAAELVSELRGRLDVVRAAVAGRSGPGVLAVEWLDPVFVPGHWVPEQIELAGGRNLAGEMGARSVEAEPSDLAELDADVLVIMPCGYDLGATQADADAHGELLARIAPRAVRQGRAWAVDGSAYFNRSGPRVVRGVEVLAGLLHPGAVPAPGAQEAAVWRRA